MHLSHSQLLILAQGAAFAVMGVTFLLSVRRRDLGWVDVGWTAGLGLVAILFAGLTEGVPWRRGLVAVLAAAWSFRLAGYILRRILTHEEDARYLALRKHWGRRTNRYAFVLFMAESFLITLFAVPFLIVMRNPNPALSGWDVAGVLIWIVSVAGEGTADRQLHRFRSLPENRSLTCRNGLWRYSRHPNYFFEWTHWFAYAVMSVGAPHGAWAWLGPVAMFVFLFKVTGIPLAEKQALARRGDDYRRYQQTTSIFIPWFPRRENAL